MGSEDVFRCRGLNPNLFVNEVFNSVHDLLEEALHYASQEAPGLVEGISSGGDRKSEQLRKIIGQLYDNTQAILNKNLANWEHYCLHNCFVIPEGFSLQARESSDYISALKDSLLDGDIDNEIQSLRDKLVKVQKESIELQRTTLVLEKQSAFVTNCDSKIAETLQLYEENKYQDLIRDVGKASSVLHIAVQNLRKRKQNHGNLPIPKRDDMNCKLDLEKAVELLKNRGGI